MLKTEELNNFWNKHNIGVVIVIININNQCSKSKYVVNLIEIV